MQCIEHSGFMGCLKLFFEIIPIIHTLFFFRFLKLKVPNQSRTWNLGLKKISISEETTLLAGKTYMYVYVSDVIAR